MRAVLLLACSALASCRNVPMIEDAHEAALDPSTELDLARELDSLRQDVAKVQAHARSKAFTGVGRLPGTHAAGIEEFSAERLSPSEQAIEDMNAEKCPLAPNRSDATENLVKKYGVEWHTRQKERVRLFWEMRKKPSFQPFQYCCLPISKDKKVESDLLRKGELQPMDKCRCTRLYDNGLGKTVTTCTTCVGFVTVLGDPEKVCAAASHRT